MDVSKVELAENLSESLRQIKDAIEVLEGKQVGFKYPELYVKDGVNEYTSIVEIPKRCNGKVLEVLKEEKKRIEDEIEGL